MGEELQTGGLRRKRGRIDSAGKNRIKTQAAFITGENLRRRVRSLVLEAIGDENEKVRYAALLLIPYFILGPENEIYSTSPTQLTINREVIARLREVFLVEPVPYIREGIQAELEMFDSSGRLKTREERRIDAQKKREKKQQSVN